MKITPEDLDTTLTLSRLEIPADEREKYMEQLGNILEYVENLSKVPTESVEPLAHVLPIVNVMREDVVKPSLDRELALSTAPLKEDGYFKVPKILEDSTANL